MERLRGSGSARALLSKCAGLIDILDTHFQRHHQEPEERKYEHYGDLAEYEDDVR